MKTASLRRSPHFVALLPVAVLCAGCTSLPGLRPLTFATPGEARVFASPGRCPHEPVVQGEAAPLIAAVLTAAASQLLTNFGTALSEGAKGGNLPSSVATLNMTLPPDGVPRCLLIVRGSFESQTGQAKPISMEALFDLPAGAETELKARLDAFTLPSVYRVDHLVEIQVLAAPNNRALSFAPLFVRLDRSLDESQEGSSSLSVGVKFQRVGASSESGSVVVVPDLTIGKHGPALQLNPKSGRFPRESPWFGTFHSLPAAASAEGPPPPPIALTTVFSPSETAVPVTLTTTVVETRPTREGLAFIASIFSSVKPKIEEALKPVLDPNFKAAEEQKQLAAELTGDAEHEAALTAAKLAVLAYCSASSSDPGAVGKQDRLTKSSAARVAQLKANASAVKYGKTRAYDTYVAVSEGSVPTSSCF